MSQRATGQGQGQRMGQGAAGYRQAWMYDEGCGGGQSGAEEALGRSVLTLLCGAQHRADGGAGHPLGGNGASGLK